MLAVLVVFIHNNFTASVALKENVIFNQSVFGKWIQLLISEGIARCAVPLFFVFAGFLQAAKNEKYSILLKKKAKSLLLPYILWISIYGFYVTALKLFFIKICPAVVKFPEETCLNWTFVDWLHKIFGYSLQNGANVLPEFAIQFWFVRDLIILTIISPIFIFLIKKIPLLFCVLLLFLVPINTYIVQMQALMFYILGLYWGIYNFDLFKIVDKIGWIEILSLFGLSFFLYYSFFAEIKFIYQFMILCACVILLKFSSIIVKSEKCFKISKYLAGFSFWLYAIHMPVLNKLLQRIWTSVFPMKNGFWCLVEYFCVTILIILIALALGIILKKIFPKLFAFLTGGR